MKTKSLVIGAIAVTAVVASGWALAQTVGPPSGFGPPFMHGKGHGPGMMKAMDGTGHRPGMMKGMDHGAGHAPGMMKGQGPGLMHGRHGAALTDPSRLEALKGELGITAAQEAAWTKYAKAAQDATTAMKTARESVDHGAVSSMPPAERFAFVSRMREQRQKQFEAIRTAIDELLAVLDDTQRAKASDLLAALAFGPGPMWGASATDQRHKH